MSEAKIVCAGFGGQGVMSMGRLIAYTGMLAGKQVSWLPSYGPEMRGGTANCHVLVSESPIGSPIIHQDATAAIVMNLPSMHKFEAELLSGGLLVTNSSLIEESPRRGDIELLEVPANDIAIELGVDKAANMVMLGAFLGATALFTLDETVQALGKVFAPSKAQFLPKNEEALRKGGELGEAFAKEHPVAVGGAGR
ncbi:MAG: 2-oxoacid:acceptor oxidoreductase family protein [Alkalispirochaetaceae bacterium]